MKGQSIFRQIVAALLLFGAVIPPLYATNDDDTLRWASDRELGSLDYFYYSTREGIIISHLIWDSLIYRDPQTFEYKPLLATSWKWVDDTTIEMELRKGVKFQNGEAFNADDVVYTLNYVVDPKTRCCARATSTGSRAPKNWATTKSVFI